MSWGFVLPSDTPMREVKEPLLPATGPYMLSEYSPQRISAVRNPEFTEWSPAAQPDGYVDEILFVNAEPKSADPGSTEGVEAAARTVEENENDLLTVAFELPAELIQRLQREYTERVHIRPFASTYGIAMNTRVPPFDDPDVRRAVNYSIDRDQLVASFGGPELAAVTCQILPSTIPGYEPYCPYTAEPKNGRWSGPDLGRARSLIQRSGYEGSRVVIHDAVIFHGLGDYMKGLLTDLGFRARVEFITDVGKYFNTISDSGSKTQMFGVGWIADYSVPSNFLYNLFSCERYIPNSLSNTNYSRTCVPQIDRAMEKAFRLDSENPAAGREQWAAVERMIMDHAGWAPFLNAETVGFVSDRVGNYQHNPQWGALFSQLWVE